MGNMTIQIIEVSGMPQSGKINILRCFDDLLFLHGFSLPATLENLFPGRCSIICASQNLMTTTKEKFVAINQRVIGLWEQIDLADNSLSFKDCPYEICEGTKVHLIYSGLFLSFLNTQSLPGSVAGRKTI